MSGAELHELQGRKNVSGDVRPRQYTSDESPSRTVMHAWGGCGIGVA